MSSGTVSRDGHRWLVRFPFDEALVARVRTELPQRAWKRELRAWEVPSTPTALPPLLTLAESVGFDVPDELRAIVAKIEAEKRVRHDLSSALTADAQPDGLTRELLPYQRAGVAYLTRAKRALLADFAGCVSGDAEVTINRAGCSRRMPLATLFERFNRGKWRSDIPSKIRSLVNGEIRLAVVSNVMDSGIKHCIRLRFASGKDLIVTPEHRIAIPDGEWVEAQKLELGDAVLTNGRRGCLACGKRSDLITYQYAKFRGYCKRCVYRGLRKFAHWNGGKFFDKSGYVMVSGQYWHPRAKHGAVREHVLVVERSIGRYLRDDESVHHRNGDKADNRIENLVVLNKKEHSRLHGDHRHISRTRWDGAAFAPTVDTIIAKEDTGERHVYDVEVESSANFVANGVVVHNSGKSAQTLATLQACNAWPAVIACPATLRATWRDEIAKWLPDRSSRILLGQPKSFGVAQGILDDQPRVNVYVVGYDCLEAWADALIEDVVPRGFVADEAHLCANVKTHRTKAAQRIAKDCDVRLALSASFLLNLPVDLIGPLQIVGRLDDLGGYWTFTNRWCGAWTMELCDGRKIRMTNRATNLPELQASLRSTCFVCRKRSDVLPELPPVRRARVPLELDEDSAAEYRAASRDLTVWLSERLWTNGSLDGMTPAAKSAKVAAARLAALSRDERAEGMVRLGALRQLAGRGKVDAALSWLDGLLTGDEGILVFAWHRDVLARLGKELGCPVLHGDSTPTERESACFAFQAGTIKVLCLQAMLGLGLTLTAAQHVVTVELPWRPADLEQCEGRAYGRINDAHGINSWVLVAEGTVDEKVLGLIETKAEIASDALGGDASSILLGLIATEGE